MQFTAVPWLRDHLVGPHPGPRRRPRARPPRTCSRRFEQLTKNLPEVLQLRRGRLGQLFATPGAAGAASPSSPPSCRCSRATPTSSWTPSGRRSSRRVGEIRRKFDAAPQQRGRRRPAAAQAARSRGQDAAVPRRRRLRPGRHRPGRLRRLQRRLDLARRRCPGPPRSSTRAPGCAGSTAERCEVPQHARSRPRRRRHPARGARARWPTCPRAASCSSPARAAPTPWRSPPPSPSRRRAPACAAGAVVVDHGLQDGSAAGGRRPPRRCAARSGSTRSRSSASEVRPSGAGLEAAARPPATPPSRRPPTAGASAVLLGHTLDDQAETVLLGLARGSGARSLAGMPARRDRCVRPLLGRRRGPRRAPPARPGLDAVGRPAQRRPRVPPGRGCAHGCCRVLEAELGPGRRARRWPARPTCCATDADALDELADRAVAELPGGRRPAPAVDALAALPLRVRTRGARRLLRRRRPAHRRALDPAHSALDALALAGWHGAGWHAGCRRRPVAGEAASTPRSARPGAAPPDRGRLRR